MENKLSFFQTLLAYLGLSKFLKILENETKTNEKSSSKSTDQNLKENKSSKNDLKTYQNAVVFWHNTEYRVGQITRQFENGSVEILQLYPESQKGILIRKNKKSLVLDGQIGTVTIN